ncbi:TrlF family AAA-like ATPase [Paracoccus marcusii]|uniref:TrlF family AAA-like ATPase n=1 Tax=Paracoccus marcusii TaxID=59779 RepID=UPI0035A5C758
MKHLKGHHPGTIWRKSDLQCHSPRDHSWRGLPTGLPGGTVENEAARQLWASGFLNECERRNISVVAITDHHDFQMAECVAQEAKKTGRVSVFRGIEVTCEDNVQCLAIFEPECEKNVLTKFLGMLPGIMEASSEAGKAEPTKPCRMSLSALFDAVSEEPLVRDHCILLPHFSTLAAHKSANAKGFNLRFADLTCDGVYIEVPYGDLDNTTLDKIQGRVPDWGKRRRAIISTGDNKCDTYDRLGKYECWIKLGEHSLDSLRQAMLADEARITFAEPQIPSERITQLVVRSSITGNEELSVSFNAGFNALIGGRGSGKSSLIEYLRFGLARTASDLGSREGTSFRERDERLIDDTLQSDGYVAISLERDGISEVWRRTGKDRDHITVAAQDGTEILLTLDDARRRFRARAFEQKGLSSTMNDRAKAADQITGIAAAEELEQRRQIDEDIAKSKRAITTALRQAAAYWQLTREEARATSKVADLRLRLDANSERLQADGVDDAAMRVLKKAPLYSQANAYLKSIEESTDMSSKKIADAKNDILKTPVAECPLEFSHFSEIEVAAAAARQRIHELLLLAGQELDAFRAKCMEIKVAHQADMMVFNTAHDVAVAQQFMHRQAIDDNQRLTKEFEAAIEDERQAKAAAEAQADCVPRLEMSRENLKINLEKRRAILVAAAEKVAGHSGDALIARLKLDPSPEEYKSALEAICTGSYLQDANDRCHQRVENMRKEEWNSICDTVIEIYRDKIMMGSGAEPSDAQADRLGKALFSENFQMTPRTKKRFFAALDDAMVGSFLAAAPKDFIMLTYVDEQRRKIPFERASPGQQASALLELLLSQSAGTLIIDQPEDDLDNKIVMKIVEQIRLSKSQRQLIFATHNPNVVVNGDADKVISLTTGEPDPRPDMNAVRIAIDEDGAIETPAIKKSITHTMEGGEPAFELRRRKYRF